jgi:hypothetical protein
MWVIDAAVSEVLREDNPAMKRSSVYGLEGGVHVQVNTLG